ncbi:MAG: spermidine synthase [Betaproteobacteria bacterium]
MSAALHAATIFSSAFLLFLVQPIVSKHILPWFGGSAAVWATCLVFFQSALLLGYAYADRLTRWLTPRKQVWQHAALLLLSLLMLPVLADGSWRPTGSEDPSLYILMLLSATVGLPYLMLSTTGPLIQAWAASAGHGAQVYRLFSLSNLASLLALLSYPFLIEPWLSLQSQSLIWSTVYTGFVVLCASSGLILSRQHKPASEPMSQAAEDPPPTVKQQAIWLSLAALSAWLLLAVTNHITQNIAAIPFLWILPLTLYLLSFVLCFESDRWYRRRWWLPVMVVLICTAAYGLQDNKLGLNIVWAIPLYCGTLLVATMFLHGELAALRPSPRHLTRFYLALSLGGAIGGALVGLLAPRVLPAYYELGIGLVLTGLLAAWIMRDRKITLAIGMLLAAFCALMLWRQVQADLNSAHLMTRNFYGRLLVRDIPSATPTITVRRLLHGAILHGEEYLSGPNRNKPTTYYGISSGIGRLLAVPDTIGQRVVGVVGLGTGTLAAYGEHGDRFRFYDIDPAVIHIAQTEFGYLRNSHAVIETVLGDARLNLERETPNRFDVLAIDAFSGDSIPVHLITREAMALYRKHMKPDGVIAFHVSNRYLALAPVVEKLAEDAGMHAMLISDNQPASPLLTTDWVLVASTREALMQPSLLRVAKKPPMIDGLRAWTDDSNNLFKVLK